MKIRTENEMRRREKRGEERRKEKVKMRKLE
jgi:hypothetical protein